MKPNRFLEKRQKCSFCGNCHFFSDYACVIDGPYRGAEEQKVAEGEWCGQFKGRMI
jgi:hypothetical protein